MADNFPHAKQRAALKKLALVINSSPKALRDDECGDPRINGSSGHIYATPRGFQLCVMTETARGWTAAKKALAFTQLANAGDTEGVLFLPSAGISPAQAKAIRSYLGIPNKREVSEETKAILRERLQALAGKAINAPESAPASAGVQ
jgi:hypothetical protein